MGVLNGIDTPSDVTDNVKHAPFLTLCFFSHVFTNFHIFMTTCTLA